MSCTLYKGIIPLVKKTGWSGKDGEIYTTVTLTKRKPKPAH